MTGWGGKRKGAGRRRKPTTDQGVTGSDLTAFDYCMAVMNDVQAEVERRDAMAFALLRHFHDVAPGKKQRLQQKAERISGEVVKFAPVASPKARPN